MDYNTNIWLQYKYVCLKLSGKKLAILRIKDCFSIKGETGCDNLKEE